MMEFLSEYGLFFAKTLTIVVAMLIALGGVVAISSKNKLKDKEKFIIKKLNKHYENMRNVLNEAILNKHEQKKILKEQKKAQKIKQKQYKEANEKAKRRLFVLTFKGDIKASSVNSLREEITAILTVATPHDEILVRLESPGGMVVGYGLAASQLNRIRERKIPLVVTIDKVAASGGYMMACVADRILAAPFAIVGSIGVVAQLPNFNRLLKKHDVDFEQITAGEYKRTLSLFGENTSKGRKKFQEDIETLHELFKHFVAEHRPIVNIDKIATGEYWHGIQALELKLIDKLMTSDDYLFTASEDADLYEISYQKKKSLLSQLSGNIQTMWENLQLNSFS